MKEYKEFDSTNIGTSIPLQNIIQEDIDAIREELPRAKYVDVSDLQTSNYRLTVIYKPISRVFQNEEV